MQLNWALETRVFDEMVARTSAADRKAFFDLSMEPRSARPKIEYPVDRGVALFDVMGVLSKDGPDLIDLLFGEGGTATAPLAEAIGRAADDSSVMAIFIDIDSPGGTVDGTAAVADAVYAAAQKKPVFAFAGDCIASAAYWIGSQATKLFVGPTSTVGSIGVYTVLVDSSRRASNEGVEVKVIKSGEMKGAGAPGTPITDAQVADTQRVIDDLNAHFVAAVARGRGMRMKHERNADGKPIPADGRVFIGQQAVDMGLADGVMDRSAALAAVSTAAMAVAPGRSVIRAETEMIGDDFVKVVRYSDGTTEMAPAADVAINKKEKKMANNIAKTLGLAEDATEEQIARAIADREQRAAELASKVAALEGTVNNFASTKRWASASLKPPWSIVFVTSTRLNMTGRMTRPCRNWMPSWVDCTTGLMLSVPTASPVDVLCWRTVIGIVSTSPAVQSGPIFSPQPFLKAEIIDVVA
jgi:signal peptide peptidase SppA